jgi:chaperonin cofactor prefoldin
MKIKSKEEMLEFTIETLINQYNYSKIRAQAIAQDIVEAFYKERN